MGLVTPRTFDTEIGRGAVGTAAMEAMKDGLVRRAATLPAKSIGPPTATGAGGAADYETTSGDPLEVPAGRYLFTGEVEVTYSEATVDGYVRASLNVGGSATGSASGGAGTVNSATAVSAKTLTSTTTVILTPTLLAASGGAGTTSTTLRATRIAEA